jgi:hypothetical protein
MEEHIKLMQIDMEYRKLFNKKLELERKTELSEGEKNLLENIKKKIQDKLDTIGYNLDGIQ